MADLSFQALLKKTIDDYTKVMGEQIERSYFWTSIGPSSEGPMHGPPTPHLTRTELSVVLEDGYLAVNSGGWESETVMMDRADVEALIDFLQTWKDILP